jgi:hypothetical protein
MSIEPNNKDVYWDVTCDFSTAFKFNQTEGNPLSQAPVYDWDTKFYNIEVFLDATGAAILNAAGDNYEKYPEIALPILTVEMIRNENSGNFTTHYGNWFNAFGAASSDFWLFRPMVNSTSFTLQGWTIPAKWAKLSMTFKVKSYAGSNYYEVHYLFEIKKGGWHTIIPQYGFYEIPSGDKTEILDHNGKPTKKPWPLFSDGTATPNPDDTPDSIDYQIYPEFSFSSFSFT